MIRLVSDDGRAYHVGLSNFANFNSYPGCLKGLNSISLGIQFHNSEYAAQGDWYNFASLTSEQATIGIKLINQLITQHSIPHQNILAHSTISIGRKTDPAPCSSGKIYMVMGWDICLFPMIRVI